mgnify:CR=1 FL=1
MYAPDRKISFCVAIASLGLIAFVAYRFNQQIFEIDSLHDLKQEIWGLETFIYNHAKDINEEDINTKSSAKERVLQKVS